MSVKSHWPLSAVSATSSLLNLGLPIIMARLLPAEEIGLFRIFFIYLLAIPNLSFSVGFMNGIYYWAGNIAQGKTIIQAAGQVLFFVSFLISFILVALHEQVSQLLGISSTGSILFAVAAIPTILHIHYESVLIATGRVWAGAFFSATFELFRASAMIFAVFYTKNFYAVIATHLAILLLKFFIGSFLAVKKDFLTFSGRKSFYPLVFQYAAPVSLAAIFDMFVVSSDRFLLSYFLDPATFAVYMMGCLAIPPLQVFEQSVNRVLIPQIAEKLHIVDVTGVTKLIRLSMEELLLILIPATVGLITFAKPIISILFTESYVSASGFLILYAVNYLMLGIPYDIFFRAAGNSKWILRNAIQFGIASLILVTILAYLFQAVGALIGALLIQLVMRSRAMVMVSNNLKVPLQELFPVAKIAKYFFVSIILSAFSFFARSFFSSDQEWFFCCGLLFVVFYFLVEFSQLKKVFFLLKAVVARKNEK